MFAEYLELLPSRPFDKDESTLFTGFRETYYCIYIKIITLKDGYFNIQNTLFC